MDKMVFGADQRNPMYAERHRVDETVFKCILERGYHEKSVRIEKMDVFWHKFRALSALGM